jgi:demethylmenaquinone methyltransferase / 2-methoxy-6-polyprenyl-1,4-benzoquinol methylase
MTVKPYSAQGSKKEQVGQMFDNISGTYDLLNRSLSMGIDQKWRKRLVNRLVTHNPKKILDLATGTGDLAIAVAKALPQAFVTGSDLSAGMLDQGRIKVNKANLAARVSMDQVDAEQMPYETGNFDALTISFGVRNFENLDAGLKEMCRVTKPGGQLYILEFSRPKGFLFKQLFNTYFRYILPTIGRLTSRDARAYTYLYESVQVFPEGDIFLQHLTQAGFSKATCTPLTFGVCSLYEATK